MSARATNFGRNVAIEARAVFVPETESEVLACLQEHREREIRVIGSLHSWSEAALPGDVAIDLRHFNHIELGTGSGNAEAWVDVGGGCTIDRLLDYLREDGRYTLPVYGIVGKQTVAGAISTATHGSGRSSMSQYVIAASVAAFDGKFNAQVYRWERGDQLAAVRCGLGCTGVILSVRLQLEPDFHIEERGEWFDALAPLLEAARDQPRTQFYLMPWSWRWYAQLRRPVDPAFARVPGLVARVLRLFRLVAIDMLLHGAIRYLASTARRRRHLPWLFTTVLPMLAPPGIRVVDESRRLLTLRHDLWTHAECEIFVRGDDLPVAATLVEWALRCCAGEERPSTTDVVVAHFGAGIVNEIADLCGTYVHDYLITFRRVLRDDTLISMTSGTIEEWYAISLVTYQPELTRFLRVSRFLAKTMARTLGARPHWGKIFPLTTDETAALYPRLPAFRQFCASIDPAQVFVNDFARGMLGFRRAERCAGSSAATPITRVD
jgi:FAD/FMN-containing dehydrogenase